MFASDGSFLKAMPNRRAFLDKGVTLGDANYVGFTAYTDDEFDQYGISSKYFASLGADRFIAVGVSLAEQFDRSTWAANADYYFSKMTSVGMSYSKEDSYSLNAKHFFNQNWALEAGFASNTDNSDYKAYSLSVTGQF